MNSNEKIYLINEIGKMLGEYEVIKTFSDGQTIRVNDELMEKIRKFIYSFN